MTATDWASLSWNGRKPWSCRLPHAPFLRCPVLARDWEEFRGHVQTAAGSGVKPGMRPDSLAQPPCSPGPPCTEPMLSGWALDPPSGVGLVRASGTGRGSADG